jgi:hypothetical protein
MAGFFVANVIYNDHNDDGDVDGNTHDHDIHNV